MCNLFTGPKLLRAALSFDPNNFSIPDDICVGRGAGVFPAGALLNHSCAPSPPGSVIFSFSASPAAAASSSQISTTPSRPSPPSGTAPSAARAAGA
jgi:hypothetical protein